MTTAIVDRLHPSLPSRPGGVKAGRRGFVATAGHGVVTREGGPGLRLLGFAGVLWGIFRGGSDFFRVPSSGTVVCRALRGLAP